MHDPAVIQIFERFPQVNAAVRDSFVQAKVVADFAQDIYTGDAGYCVCNGMEDDIGITVAFQGGAPSKTTPPRISFLPVSSKSNL